ncbi:hypothetical protein [Nocardia sp. NBC_01388]|uniref:hypothetical protein n=1 Tax=Nocardia sp. NBC_01388 TaxID=2903596 RepID=UPI003254A36D
MAQGEQDRDRGACVDRDHGRGGFAEGIEDPGDIEVPLAALRTWAEDHMAEIDRAGAVNDAQADPTASE